MKKSLWVSPFFNVILFSFFWAIQILINKIAYIQGAPLIPFTMQSSIIALVLLTVYILLFRKNKFKEVSRDVFIGLLIANVFHGGFGGFFSNAGTLLTAAINVGFLVQFATVSTTLLAWVILKEKMTVSKSLTVGLILLGTFLLVTNGKFITPHVGDIFILLACVSWSTGNVLVRKILKNHPVDSDIATFFRPVAALPVLLGFILLAPLYPPQVKSVFEQNLFDFHFFIFAFFNALFVVLLWIFLNRTLKVASASYMSMMSSVTPVFVAILAILVLGESLSPIQWVGALLITLSSFVTQMLKIEKH